MLPYICLFGCLVICAFFETNNVSFLGDANNLHGVRKRNGYIIVPLIIILILEYSEKQPWDMTRKPTTYITGHSWIDTRGQIC